MSRISIKTLLASRLGGEKRLAVLAIGSDLRADDAAGILVGESIIKRNRSRRLKVFLGQTAPENLTGEIKRYKPSHLLIIDAADTANIPGTIDLIDPKIVGGISFSTHMMPLKIMVDYIRQSIKCKVMIIGIQPKVLAFGSRPSKPAMDSAREVAGAILSLI